MRNDELIDVESMARELRVSVQSVLRLAKSGKIPAYRVGAQYRFDAAAVRSALVLRSGSSPDPRSGR